MSRGPGKYDDEASAARVATGGHMVVLVVLGGMKGNGFSVQGTDVKQLAILPDLLRHVAVQIEGDLKKL